MLFDLHNDILISSQDFYTDATSYNGSLTDVAFAIWTTELDLTIDDLHKFAIPMGIDYNAHIAIEDLGGINSDDFESIFEILKPLYVSLNWNGQNRLGGGSGSEVGITELGYRAVTTMNALKILLDLSHLSDKSFGNVIANCACKKFYSHTACRDICNHSRCITDSMIREIAKSHGIIGVCAVPNFLKPDLKYGENCTSEDYIKHILHIANLVGVEYVAVGTDYFGTEYLPRGLETYKQFEQLKYELEKYMSSKEIDKIFYYNAKKFFEI